MRCLVIVESGTKANTISKYLNKIDSSNKYNVIACNGHICDLVKDNYGLDNKLEPVYKTIDSKIKTINKLKEESKNADIVLLASDNDREGEAIAWHLKNLLKLKKYKRIIFNEITETALKTAIQNPKDIDMKMVNSQQGRRVLDRLIGFGLTKQLWKNFNSNTVVSAGRVQSVVLKIIIEKELEIRKFVSEKYWNVLSTFNCGIENAKLYNNKDIIHKYFNKSEVISLFENLSKKYTIDTGKSKIKKLKEYPDKPLTTSTLQQRAFNELGFSIQKTMKIAQELYEHGHITYMRTDSTNLSNDFVEKARKSILNTFGERYINKNIKSITSSKNAQEAHEAIRPTKLENNESKLSKLSSDQSKLYKLIYQKTIASQMTPAEYEELNVIINNEYLLKKQYYFVGKIKHLVFNGYKVLYGQENNTDNLNKTVEKLFKNTNIISKEIIGNCIWTSPPQRYNESSIIKHLEDIGIGRPSTYVSIINKLYERNFVNKANVSGETKLYEDIISKDGKIVIKKMEKTSFEEKSKLLPSESGLLINQFLINEFKDIVNQNFTSHMENELDQIANGKASHKKLIEDYYTYVKTHCESTPKIKTKNKLSLNTEQNEFTINKQTYIVRNGKYGALIEIPVMNGGKSKFIGLKPFLQVMKITLNDVSEEDIKLIVELPINYKSYVINYGRYGFYTTNTEGKSLTIYKQFIQNLKNKDYTFIDSMYEKYNDKKSKK